MTGEQIETQECPHCYSIIDARASVCPVCRRDVFREQGVFRGQRVYRKTEKKKEKSWSRRWLKPFVAIVLIIIACSMGLSLIAGLNSDTTSAPSRKLPATFTPASRDGSLPATFTPASGGPANSGSRDDNPGEPGIGYLWSQDKPANGVPVFAMIHDRWAVDEAEFNRWVQNGQACWVTAGTKAVLENARIISSKIDITIQNGSCVDFYGWTDREFWQKTRP